MTLTELKELRDQVRGLKGADREVDAEIDAAINGGFASHKCHDATRRSYSVGYVHADDDGSHLTKGGRHSPAYTGSTDAALAFSEKALPGWMVEYMGQQAHGSPGSLVGFGWCVELSDGSESRSKQGQAPALPLAIIDATLTALIETME